MMQLTAARELSTLREDLLNVVIVALLFALGLAALAVSASRQRTKNRFLLDFGIACGLYGFRLLGNTGLVYLAVSLPQTFWRYQDAIITYLIPIPALLFGIYFFGPGWKSSLRLMLWIQAAYTTIAISIDIILGPHAAMGPNSFLVILDFLVITANGLQFVFQKDEPIGWEARLVLTGALFFALLAVNTNLVDKHLVPWRVSYEPLGMLVFVICLGVVTAHRFFANERELLAVGYELRVSALRAENAEAQAKAAEAQVRAVEAESRRQAQELEEARRLQLSMLPTRVPQLPGFEIAAYCKPASEVGGDYYDFHFSEDGTLTVAVGDATGHGLKAGTMVTAVKALFEALAHHPNIPQVFERLSDSLKRMNWRSLFMAMTMVKVRGPQMKVGIAGMPSVLLWYAANGQVEEIAIRGIPLGGLSNYKYQQEEFVLSPDDVVVLMSDGLAERFNEQQEMLDYEPIKRSLTEIANRSPQEIITQLVGIGDQWAGNKPQDDDVTLVVIKKSRLN